MNAGLSRVVLTVFKQELSSVSKRLSPPTQRGPRAQSHQGPLGTAIRKHRLRGTGQQLHESPGYQAGAKGTRGLPRTDSSHRREE